MVLTTVSSELLEDAVVNIGDDIAGEVAYAFASKEDSCGFLGDGTSTYGGIVGLESALTDATYQVSTGAGTALSTVTLSEINAAFAKLPAWSYQRSNVKIYCHKSVYHNVFERLAMAAGGVTAAEVAAGTSPRFFGYPVEFAQVMVAAPAGADATFAFIGDLSQGCYFGDRRSTSVAFSDSALNSFEQDEKAVRGTERFDIVCANVGGSTASGAVIKVTL
jgi:HK97 family phage major capsid protein